MSLLLDALKRAEEAKRAKLSVDSSLGAQDAQTAPKTVAAGGDEGVKARVERTLAANIASQDLSLEDYKEVIQAKEKSRSSSAIKESTVYSPHKAELSLEGVPADDLQVNSPSELAIAAPPPGLQSRLDATSVDAAQSRDSARNVFVAKHPAGTEPGAQKKWLLPVIAVVLVAVSAGGWYVWKEVNGMARPVSPLAAAPRPVPSAALPQAQPTTGQPGVRPSDPSAAIPSAPVEAPLPPLLPPPAVQIEPPRTLARVTTHTGAPITQRELLAKSLKEAPLVKDSAVELKLARSINAPGVSADLTDAYAALRAGDYQRAQALYGKLVISDPLNPDVQLGMATVFARKGDPASAARHYRQTLVIDPRNGSALSGLLAMSDSASQSMEIEVKTLIGRSPDTASLHFSLGNIYASERRWVEAQQAFFEAYRLESDNPDYVFNLAVSLDQLKQSKLARDFYQKALALAPRSGAQFDAAAATRRIRELAGDTKSN